jgi:hypothetical protein
MSASNSSDAQLVLLSSAAQHSDGAIKLSLKGAPPRRWQPSSCENGIEPHQTLLGKNSFLQRGYLAPDPPRGHGAPLCFSNLHGVPSKEPLAIACSLNSEGSRSPRSEAPGRSGRFESSQPARQSLFTGQHRGGSFSHRDLCMNAVRCAWDLGSSAARFMSTSMRRVRSLCSAKGGISHVATPPRRLMNSRCRISRALHQATAHAG